MYVSLSPLSLLLVYVKNFRGCFIFVPLIFINSFLYYFLCFSFDILFLFDYLCITMVFLEGF